MFWSGIIENHKSINVSNNSELKVLLVTDMDDLRLRYPLSTVLSLSPKREIDQDKKKSRFYYREPKADFSSKTKQGS